MSAPVAAWYGMVAGELERIPRSRLFGGCLLGSMVDFDDVEMLAAHCVHPTVVVRRLIHQEYGSFYPPLVISPLLVVVVHDH